MKVLHLYTQSGGVDLWRMKIPAKALRGLGHEVIEFTGDNNAYEDAANQNRGEALPVLCNLMNEVDVVHVGYSDILPHTELLVAMREHALRQGREVPIITDMDDDIINVPKYNLGYKAYHPGAPGRRVVLLQMHVSDGVAVSTEYLKGPLRPHARALYHLPNLDDASRWSNMTRNPDRGEDESVRLLFAGGQGRYGDLEVCREAAEWAMGHYDGQVHGGTRRPMLRLFFIACTPDWAKPWMADNRNPANNRAFHIWHSDPKTYHRTLTWLEPDIMINPIVCNDFNKGKSCIKAYEAAHAGAAFLGTDWETHAIVPKDACVKVDNTFTQWQESIGNLVEDKGLRQRLNTRLLDWVLAERQIGTHIHLWQSAYEDAIKRGVIKDLADVVNPKEIHANGDIK